MWKSPVSLRRIGAFAGALVLACVPLGCPAPARAPDVANALRPLVEQHREEDAQLSLNVKKLECLMEGWHAASVARDREEQRLTLDEALAYVDLLVARALHESRTSSGLPWPDRLRAVTATVYAHPNWTRVEAERQVLDACLHVHGLSL
jgi:hypothetical protein